MIKIKITMYWGLNKVIIKKLFKSKQEAIDFYNTREQQVDREYNNIKLTKIEEDKWTSIK
tara:strand:+ start:1541 stop:1720 length:180 start_codon:yes stop_codon:yes gene_type:complete